MDRLKSIWLNWLIVMDTWTLGHLPGSSLGTVGFVLVPSQTTLAGCRHPHRTQRTHCHTARSHWSDGKQNMNYVKKKSSDTVQHPVTLDSCKNNPTPHHHVFSSHTAINAQSLFIDIDPLLSVAKCSLVQLSELEQRRVNKLDQDSIRL